MSAPRFIAKEVLVALREGPAKRADLMRRLPDWPPRRISNGLYTLQRNNLAILFHDDTWQLTAHGATTDPEALLPGAAGESRARKTTKKRTLRQRAWAALRRKGGKATIPDLMRALGTDREMDANNIGCYFRRLAAVGLLTNPRRRVAGNDPTSNGHLIWMVPLDAGPRAPMWQTGKNVIHDPNTGKTYALPPKGVTP